MISRREAQHSYNCAQKYPPAFVYANIFWVSVLIFEVPHRNIALIPMLLSYIIYCFYGKFQCDIVKVVKVINPLSANPIKWSNTLKQFVGKLPTNCLSVFDHFVKLAFKGLKEKGGILLRS